MALNYGTSTALTITAGSLASAAARSSAAVTTGTTNSTDDVMVSVNVLTTTTTTTGNRQAVVYVYGSEDGTNYGGDSATVDNVDGTDKALTAIGAPSVLRFAQAIPLLNSANAITVRGQPFSLRSAFGGVLPRKWGIVIVNDSGTAFGATVGASYTEIYYT